MFYQLMSGSLLGIIKYIKKLNHIGDLFENNGKMRSWEDLRAKLGLDDNKNFTGDKLSTQSLVLRNLDCGDNISDLIINEHHLIKKHQIYCLEKLNSRGLYNMQLLLNVEKPTAQTYFEKKI